MYFELRNLLTTPASNDVERLRDVLEKDPERGREELREVLEERVRLRPDDSGRFLWADYSLGLRALIPNAEIVVAGARFATFAALDPVPQSVRVK